MVAAKPQLEVFLLGVDDIEHRVGVVVVSCSEENECELGRHFLQELLQVGTLVDPNLVNGL